MAEYNSLLLGMGGGIISRRAQSRQYDDAATLAIGIGGTGVAALRVLKQKVYQQLIPDDPNAAVPEYGHIRFLAIDSDDTVERGGGIGRLLDSEYFSISSPTLKNVFTEQGKAQVRKNPLFNWMEIDKMDGLLSPDGAGGVRQIGRYLLMSKAGELRTKIQQECSLSLQHVNGNKLDVYIFAGISGGTGSGCFIDTCYIVKDVLEKNGWLGSAKVMGFFFLPDVVTSKPEVAKMTGTKEYNDTNGYAAMKELDYLMDLGSADDWFAQNYGSFRIRTQEAPVDMCHLVSASQADGSVLRNAFSYCINVAADYVMAYLAYVNKKIGVKEEDDGGITLRGHLANVNNGVSHLKQKHGARRNYHVMGASNAEIPITQIMTYLATGFFRKFQESVGRQKVNGLISKAAVDSWFAKLQLGAGAVQNQVRRGCPGLILPDMDLGALKAYGIPQPGKVIQPWCDPGNDYLDQCAGRRKANTSALNQKLETFDIRKVRTGNVASLLERVYGQLYQLCMDPEYGPYYALELLHNENGGYDLRTAVDGAYRTLKEQQQTQYIQLHGNSRSGGLDAAMYQAATIFCNKAKKKNYSPYKEAVMRYYETLNLCNELGDAAETLRKLRQDLDGLYASFFKPLAELFDGLKTTFDVNRVYLAEPENTRPKGFTKSILDFSQVRPQLDDAIGRLQPGVIVGDFVRVVLEKPDEWLAGDDEKIGHFISEQMEEVFKAQVNQTMNDYLRLKFPNAFTPAQLENAAREEIIRPVYDSAAAMFWCDPNFAINDPLETYQTGTITAPALADSVCSAADSFALGSTSAIAVRRSDVKDRIFAMRFFSGVPFYAYQGVRTMWREYNSAAGTSAGVGSHLYAKTGRGEKDDRSGMRNWRAFLPTPAPYSLYPDMTPDADKKTKLYNDGIAQGIIRAEAEQDGSRSYAICISPEVPEHDYTKEEFLTDDGTGSTALNEVALAGTRARLQAELDGRRNGTVVLRTVDLKNDGDANLGDRVVDEVRLDYFMHFPLLQRDVERELEKQEELAREIADLDAIKEEYAQYDTDIRNFSYMLFYRLVNCLGGTGDENLTSIKKVVSAYVDSRGARAEQVFADPGTKLGEKYPLYQAFLTYRALDPKREPRKSLDKAAGEKIRGMKSAADHFVARQLDLILSSERIADISRQTSMASYGADLIRFITGLRDEISSFRTNFRHEVWIDENETAAGAGEAGQQGDAQTVYDVYDMTGRRYLKVDTTLTRYYGADTSGAWVQLDPSMLVWVGGQWQNIHLENNAFVEP